MVDLTAFRPAAMGARGMVAAAHPLATLTGLDVLRAGGNAVDAAVATNAALNVTQPGSCGIGGDLFAMVYWAAHDKVYMLNASGRAAARASVAAMIARGYSTMPERGILTVTVPGCVDGWFALLARWGSRPAQELLAPAIRLAREGFPLSTLVSRQIKATLALQPHPSWTANFAPGGRTPPPATIYRQPALAGSLELISQEGRAAFYQGPLARSIAAISRELDGLLTEDDLAAHTSTWEEPLAVEYRGVRILEAPPNTQGVTALEMFLICQGWDLSGYAWDDPRRVHRMIEAKKLAFADRDRYVADPAQVAVPVERLLSDEHTAALRAQVRDDRAGALPAGPPGAGGTTYFAVADADGNLVSCIQSNFRGFGALVVPPGTGISLHNRGSYFSLDPAHANSIAPGKRPFHTLIPAMAFRGGAPLGVFGTMGGDGQPQTHLQFISHILDHGLDVQAAIEAPRWVHGALRPDEAPDTLRLEARFPSGLVRSLHVLGHPVQVVAGLDQSMGHAQAIWLENGVYIGGADPRGDGCALGW